MRTKSIVVALLVWAQLALAGTTGVHWRDLRPMIEGRDIAIRLTDGSRIKGRASSVGADALVITNAGGPRSIPRRTVREIRVARKAGYKWRVIGTALGAGVGAAIAYPVLAETHNEGGHAYDGAAAGLIAGLAALGFWAGWSSDRQGEVITVLPD